MANWIWDESVRHYRDTDTGRILSFAAVQDLVDQIVDVTAENVTDTLSDLLADGRLNVADWMDGMIDAIKHIYIQQGELSAGGRDQMTPQFWGAIGNQLRQQYAYLRDFADQIAAGELTPGQIRARSEMYISSSRQAFWRIQDFKAMERGETEERWISMGDKNTCSPCNGADALGWMPIGTFGVPGSGTVELDPQTECVGLTRCRCRKAYR